MDKTKLLEDYSRLLDSIAWYNQGDVIELAKLAKKLGRNYTEDLAERKSALAEIGADDETEALQDELVAKMKQLGASDEQIAHIIGDAKQKIISTLFFNANK